MNPQNPLAQLHDIVVAEPISWWPLAWGWWLLALLVSALLIFTVRWLIQRHRRNQWKREARIELDILKQDFERVSAIAADKPEKHAETARLIATVNVFIKRVLASTLFVGNNPEFGDAIQSEHSTSWIAVLRQNVTTLSEADISALSDGQYRPEPEPLSPDTFKRLRSWLEGISS